jgi:hypothetical protein
MGWLGFAAMRGYLFGSLVAFVLGTGAFGCTSSQTSTALTAPAIAKCQVQVGSATTAFTADGGKGTLAVATTRDCTWSVSTSASWVAVASTSGQGEASVPYTVAANPVPISRAAEIAVSDATLQLNQAAAPCPFTVSPTSGSIGSAAGQLTVQLSTLAGCAWSATTDAPWLTIIAGASGNGNGAIGMSVAANTGPVRTAHMGAGNAVFTLTQGAAGSGPTPPPPTTPPPTTPPPTTPPPQTVSLSGTISGLSGACPAISFTVSSTPVFAISSTGYSGGKCNDLKNGKTVTVTGTVQADRRVLASLIALK